MIADVARRTSDSGELGRCYLDDIQHAEGLLAHFTSAKTLSDYANDYLLRSASARQFTIIGEAISKLANFDREIVSQITDYSRIIDFLYIFINQYASEDEILEWGVFENNRNTHSSEIDALFRKE